ncbi:hypothetical protein VNO80_27453 [Phaseolus coccineus]|uniref:Terpene synthase 11 n=1 Tax=Phaseolus coccineus TaxID=3886 RepID=A0AAN9LGL6_PHACN
MVVTEASGVSLTTSLASHTSRPSMHSPCILLSFQTSPSHIMIKNKLSIKSVAFRDKVPSLIDLGTKRMEQVKRRSQETLLNSSDPIKTLKIIDTIQRLGIGHHFEEEINVKLGKLGDWDFSEDLFSTTLQFRLLRNNGWPTTSDAFKKFLDKSGNFKESISNDIWGMLSMYEASYLGAKGEEVLEQAMDFSTTHLHQSLPHLSPDVGNLVARALTLPRHLRMSRLEARNYIEEYSQVSNHMPYLLEMAKIDYAMVQSMHQKELAEISRWWNKLGLAERLGFARDKPAECFLWTMGIFPEPCYSNCRIELTKTICILLVMDDIFDTYGTLDELILFTKAIKRWDLDAMEQLPKYMKISYLALYNTTHEIAYKIQMEHGQNVVSCLKRTWIDIFEAFLKEAKWFSNKYVPTFKEYLANGVISSGSYMALVHATFLSGDGLSKETISMMNPYPRLFSCSGEILRLWDDLGTSKEEQERGDNACSIQCLMTENNISDENVARKHIRRFIRNLWPELNSLALTTTSLPFSIMKASLNMARTAQVIYQHGDDQNTFTVDDYVQTLLFTPSANY